MRLVNVGGELYTLDHRRLVAFQKAGIKDVPYVIATPEEAEKEDFKFTNRAGGTSIEIRGTGEVWSPEIPEDPEIPGEGVPIEWPYGGTPGRVSRHHRYPLFVDPGRGEL